MLSPVVGQDHTFKTATLQPRFGVATPKSDPLVASAAISFTKRDRTIQITVEPTVPTVGETAQWVVDDLIGRAARDVTRFPNSSQAHTNYGLALANAGRNQEAEAEFRVALDLEQNSYLAGISLARICANQSRYGDAAAIYHALLVVNPDSLSVLMSLAFVAIQQADYCLAEEWLQRALAVKRTAFPEFLLGITRLQLGKTQAAIAALREATHLEVRTSAYHNALGIAYAAAEDYGRAERSFRIALALTPESKIVVHSLCEILLDRGCPDGVVDILKPQIESPSDTSESRELLARAYFLQGKYRNARGHIQHILLTSSGTLPEAERARHTTNVAATFAREGNHPMAERLLGEAIEIEPAASPIPYENLALLYLSTERQEDAEDMLVRAVRLFPISQALRRLLCHIYVIGERFSEGIALLHPFWADGSADADTYAGLGSLYERAGDLASAVAVLVDGHRKYRTHPGVVNNLAYFHLQLGQVDKARSVLDSLPRAVQPHAELVATYGLLRLWQGDRRGAVELYEQAEKMAQEQGSSELGRGVRQKLHLELARYWIRKGDLSQAAEEIKRGLAVRAKLYGYAKDLQELAKATRSDAA